MVKPPTLLLNNPLKTMKALFCKDLKLSSNKLLVLGSIKETVEPLLVRRVTTFKVQEVKGKIHEDYREFRYTEFFSKIKIGFL
jgi:hypothetical protein